MRPLLNQEDHQLRRIQILFAIAIFFHGVLDPAVTYIFIVHFETGLEANPFMRWGLAGGLTRFILIHIPLFVLASLCIWTLSQLLKRASGLEKEVTYLMAEFGMDILIAWGIWIVATNLWVFWISQ